MATDLTPATSQPSAIYVWLVPSEQVLEQPGGWRIRKWDTAPFPEANFTLSPKEDVGPWRIVAESNGATLYSEDFEHDVAITIGGDFADTAQAIAYAENVAKRLSTLPSAIPAISASGNYPLKFFGSPGPIGTCMGIEIHADRAVPDHTIEVRDSINGRLLGRIINVG